MKRRRLYEPYCIDWCRQRRFPTANLATLLRQRELGLRREGSQFVHGSREFYNSLPIVRTELLVHRPQIFPLRFTPDGGQLVAIGPSLQEIQLFTYRGFYHGTNVASAHLFKAIFPRCQTIYFWEPNPVSGVAGERALAPTERLQFGFLSRDCALVTPDSRFLVVCAQIFVPESRSSYRGIMRNNESLLPDKNLSDVTFYCIDLKKAQLVDRHKFELDQINVQSGVYMTEWTLAILSVQHQTIHMMAIDRQSGHFVPLMQIGHSVHEDDQLVGGHHLINARTDLVFTAFRQRLLSFLYREHTQRGQQHQFLQHFYFFRNLKMQRLQFVGPELLLIRMDLITPPDTSSPSTSSSNQQSAGGNSHQQQYMFALYQWRVGQFVGVFSRCSEELFRLFERHNECFRNGHLSRSHFPTSMEHCGPVRELHEFVKQSSYQNASPSDVRRRFLAILPLPNTQHLVTSPYLDPFLFSYDDKLVAALEKGRYPPDQPLKLFSRRTKRLHSKLDFRIGPAKSCAYTRVLFHPTDPFVLSLQVSRGVQPETLLSFHMPHRPPPLEGETRCQGTQI